MTDPIEEKINEFTKRMDTEDNLIVMKELDTYLQGIQDNEKDPLMKQQIQSYLISLKIASGLSVVAQKFSNENEKMKSELNSQLEKIIKLEKRFDELESLK